LPGGGAIVESRQAGLPCALDQLQLVTAGFVVLVIGGFLAITLLEGGGEETRDKCEAVAQVV